jgi:hypothetical protein
MRVFRAETETAPGHRDSYRDELTRPVATPSGLAREMVLFRGRTARRIEQRRIGFANADALRRRLQGARGGNPMRLAMDVHQVIIAPIGEHSAKPAEVYARIERLFAGPYLELFARAERPIMLGRL